MAWPKLRSPFSPTYVPETIDVKQAVRLAEQYLAAFYEGKDFRNIRLEEVEWLEQENTWLITLGFDAPVRDSLAAALGQRRREFKVFEIDALSGQFRAMRMRHPDHA